MRKARMTKPKAADREPEGCRARPADPPSQEEVDQAHRNISSMVDAGLSLALDGHPPMDTVAEMLFAASQVAFRTDVCLSCFVKLFGSVLREASGIQVNVRVSVAGGDDAGTVH